MASTEPMYDNPQIKNLSGIDHVLVVGRSNHRNGARSWNRKREPLLYCSPHVLHPILHLRDPVELGYPEVWCSKLARFPVFLVGPRYFRRCFRKGLDRHSRRTDPYWCF